MTFVHRALGGRIVLDLHEAKTPGLTRKAVAHHGHTLNGADSGKQILQFRFFGLKRQVSNVQLSTHD
jgi:hypothetical protein